MVIHDPFIAYRCCTWGQQSQRDTYDSSAEDPSPLLIRPINTHYISWHWWVRVVRGIVNTRQRTQIYCWARTILVTNKNSLSRALRFLYNIYIVNKISCANPTGIFFSKLTICTPISICATESRKTSAKEYYILITSTTKKSRHLWFFCVWYSFGKINLWKNN